MLNIRFLIQRYSILFLNLIFQIILFRLFSVTNAGIISYGRTLVQYFDFTNLGFRNTLDKRKYKNKESLKLLFSYVRTINLCVSLVTAFFLFLFSIDQKGLILFVLSGILYADLFYVKLFYRNEGDKKSYVSKSFIFEFIPLATLLLSIILFKDPLTVSVLFFLSNAIIYYFFNKDLAKFPLISLFKLSKRYLKKIISLNLSQGLYIFLSSLFLFFIMSGDRILIKYAYDYEVVAKISFLMLFMNGFMPLVSALIEINMKDMLHYFQLNKILKILVLILLGAILYIGLIYFIQDFAVDMFFQKYMDIGSNIVYFTILIIPCSIIQVLQIILYRQNKQHLSFLVLIVIAIIHGIMLMSQNLFSANPIFNILAIKLISLGLTAAALVCIFIPSMIKNKIKL